MLKLNTKPQACEIDLAPDVVVSATTITTVDLMAAEAEATRIMKAAMEGHALIEMLGFGVEMDGPDLTGAGMRKSWTTFIVEVLLAEQAITGWAGIGNEEGEPIEPDRRSIAALLQDPIHRAKIMTRIQQPLSRVEGEAKK